LLEDVARERLMKTQQAGNSIAIKRKQSQPTLIGREGLRKIATPVRKAVIQKYSEFGSHNLLGVGPVARIGIQEMHRILWCSGLTGKRKHRTRCGYIY
jgi:hypothetical protein